MVRQSPQILRVVVVVFSVVLSATLKIRAANEISNDAIQVGQDQSSVHARLTKSLAKDISKHIGIRFSSETKVSWWELADGRCIVLFYEKEKKGHPIEAILLLPNGYSKTEFTKNSKPVKSVKISAPTKTKSVEQDGAGQAPTRPESKSE